MQRELNLALWRSDVGDLAEAGVSDTVVGVGVAGDVEEVEEIGTEAEGLAFSDVEVLEDGAVDLFLAGGAFAAYAG